MAEPTERDLMDVENVSCVLFNSKEQNNRDSRDDDYRSFSSESDSEEMHYQENCDTETVKSQCQKNDGTIIERESDSRVEIVEVTTCEGNQDIQMSIEEELNEIENEMIYESHFQENKFPGNAKTSITSQEQDIYQSLRNQLNTSNVHSRSIFGLLASYTTNKNTLKRQNNQPMIASDNISYSGPYNGFGRINHKIDNKQYIEGIFENKRLVKVNLAMFQIGSQKSMKKCVRIYGADSLMTINSCFIARIKIDRLSHIDLNLSFEVIAKQLFDRISITKVLKDDSNEQYISVSLDFLEAVKNCAINNPNGANVCLRMAKIAKETDHRLNNNINFLRYIIRKNIFPEHLNDLSKKVLEKEEGMKNESSILAILFNCRKNGKNLFAEFKQIYKQAKEAHRSKLFSAFIGESKLKPREALHKLEDSKIFYLTFEMVQLISGLELAIPLTDEVIWTDIVVKDWNNLIKYVANMEMVQSIEQIPLLTHPIYLPLFKIFIEITSNIIRLTKKPLENVIKVRRNEIELKDIQCPTNWTLENQLKFVIKMMENYQPTKIRGRFCYDCFFVQKNEMLNNIPEDKLIWLYILDHILEDILDSLPKQKKSNFTKLSRCLIKLTLKFMEAISGQLDACRMVVSNVIEFVVEITENSKIVFEVNGQILDKQIKYLEDTIFQNNNLMVNELVGLVEMYKMFWTNCNRLMEKHCCELFKEEHNQIINQFLTIAKITVDIHEEFKNPASAYVTFLRAYNEFAEDLLNIDYTWYVKETDLVDHSYLKIVENKLKDEEKCSYMVKDGIGFMNDLKSHATEFKPPNYCLKVVMQLLAIVHKCLLQNEWPDQTPIKGESKLQIVSELLASIRSSFIYLKEQPDYRDFELFLVESTMPFNNVVNKSQSKEDFGKRCSVIKDSFWFLRKQNEIGIDQALDLFEMKNKSSLFDMDLLKSSFSIYNQKFNEFIELYNMEKSTENIIKFVKDELILTENQHQWQINKWTTSFKEEKIPALLAGLSAIWSIQQSKDMTNIRKSLKPHCIQIICILRLLSVDSGEEGTHNHFAEVLTGQGKSLVLALIGSILALMKYDVKIICYSSYLSKRDENDFESFYKIFEIDEKIVYGTFESLANELCRIKKGDNWVDIRKMIENDILNASSNSQKAKENSIATLPNHLHEKSVLLIDEVDVFFMERFFGNTYNPIQTIGMETVAEIQKDIWRMMQSNNNLNDIRAHIKKYVNEVLANNSDQIFCNFYNKDVPSNFYGKPQLNREFFKNEIETMIECAQYVNRNNGYNIHLFTLNRNNLIVKNKYGEIENVYCRYYNVFNYFLLKKKDFNSNSFQNYGYIIAKIGSISYAKLPKEYPLILGVTGTLACLSTYQKEVMENMYEIKQQSLMPSFYGPSNLKWNGESNTTILETQQQWLMKIFEETNKHIKANRSVLICLKTETEMDLFESAYKNYFAYLNKLTFNVMNKEYLISEAGVKGNVTLLTSGMGRGTDFKTSVIVEKNGGTHVIQTFFSTDENEEIQIRGRTARKDNKGSYELILCKADLTNSGYENSNDYNNLSKMREEKMDKEGRGIRGKIRESEEQHEATMNYFKTLIGNI